MGGLGILAGRGFRLDERPSRDEGWIERQRRLWQEALDKLEAALKKRKAKRSGHERREDQE